MTISNANAIERILFDRFMLFSLLFQIYCFLSFLGKIAISAENEDNSPSDKDYTIII